MTTSTRSRKYDSEAEFAKGIVQWLKDDQWEVYQEVQPDGFGRVADIVATRGPLTMIVECKLSASLDLIEQLIEWEGFAHYIVAAYPVRSSRAFEIVAKRFGFGVVRSAHGEVSSWGANYGQFRRRPIYEPKIRRRLCEELKNFAPAGNSWGARYTPYQQTCERLREYVAKNPGASLKAVMDALKGKHHYANDSSARGSIVKWVDLGKIKGVRIERIGRAVHFHPAEKK